MISGLKDGNVQMRRPVRDERDAEAIRDGVCTFPALWPKAAMGRARVPWRLGYLSAAGEVRLERKRERTWSCRIAQSQGVPSDLTTSWRAREAPWSAALARLQRARI